MSSEEVTVCIPGSARAAGIQAALAAVLDPYEFERWHVFGWDAERGLPLRAGCDADPGVIRASTYMNGAERPSWPGRCDGAPRRLLDFSVDRLPAAEQASADWSRWHEFSTAYPPARPLREFFLRHVEDPEAYSFRQARADHAAQPVMRAHAEMREESGSAVLWQLDTDPVGRYGMSLDEYVRRQVARVIPTDALITLEGEWVDGSLAAGEFSGLRLDIERLDRMASYCDFADRYLDQLHGDDVVVRVKVR